MDTKKKLNMIQREEVLAEVEDLMLKGVWQASRIAKAIKCSIPSATDYRNTIKKRWELSNKGIIYEIKSEIIEKSRRLEEAYWEAFDKADNGSARVGALNGILETQKHQSSISGWDSAISNKK
jgi:hypothetical protein